MAIYHQLLFNNPQLQRDNILTSTDKAWAELGRADPYYGVLSDARFRAAAEEGTSRDEFFESGNKHVEDIFNIIRKELDPNFSPHKAIDFGCGVGRLTIPIAKRVQEVLGLDVSVRMLEEAKRNCTNVGIVTATFRQSDDALSGLDGLYDFVHSFIVFQHIPPKRGLTILKNLLSHISDGGVIALHFTFSRKASKLRQLVHKARSLAPIINIVANIVQRRPIRYPLIQMNNYNIGNLLLVLKEYNCHQVHMRFSEHDGHVGIVIFSKKEALSPM